MAKPPSPFAGMNLTEAATHPLDQRLFQQSQPTTPAPGLDQSEPNELDDSLFFNKEIKRTSPSPRPGSNPETRKPGKSDNRQSGNPAVRESEKSESRKPGTPRVRESDNQAEEWGILRFFDLNQTPDYKETVLITTKEYEALEDLKQRIRRDLDIKATKQDLLRCAIYDLVKDFHDAAGQSIVVRHLSRKKTNH